ncbi:hypothetical protein AA106555_1889 [Neokomagataea thailandica NBRC 106555]|uniref:Uncharacterized protein n=1 Tax=Neokomagataea thailandica NBRC 106555 TaxID=1223520 RepID=A0ABQ0QSB4_9PROT|nr:hypothetical protein AA106555_1889 [Neokomagataea thailandica NBRC 106555]
MAFSLTFGGFKYLAEKMFYVRCKGVGAWQAARLLKWGSTMREGDAVVCEEI